MTIIVNNTADIVDITHISTTLRSTLHLDLHLITILLYLICFEIEKEYQSAGDLLYPYILSAFSMVFFFVSSVCYDYST